MHEPKRMITGNGVIMSLDALISEKPRQHFRWRCTVELKFDTKRTIRDTHVLQLTFSGFPGKENSLFWL